MSEIEGYNPSEFVDRLVQIKLGNRTDYTAAEYRAALDEIAVEFPDAIQQMRPGDLSQTQLEDELARKAAQAERAEKLLQDKGIDKPSAEQYTEALEQAQTEGGSDAPD